MRAYSIFDDFDDNAAATLAEAGIHLTTHPLGVPRPDAVQMKAILEEYDCAIIGTSQKCGPEMFADITGPKIIATASVGTDHIRVPEDKRQLVRIINTPGANARSVAEFTMGAALNCVKRLAEGRALYLDGKNNKALHQKPEELAGKTMGVVGAGNISRSVMDYARFFGMDVVCWTRRPQAHKDLEKKSIRFLSLEELAETADVMSVNLPSVPNTRGIISRDVISRMKERAVFISVSRLETVDFPALLKKAGRNKTFYAVLDIDVDRAVVDQVQGMENVYITPHIAGGTVEARKRMFREAAEKLAAIVQGQRWQ